MFSHPLVRRALTLCPAYPPEFVDFLDRSEHVTKPLNRHFEHICIGTLITSIDTGRIFIVYHRKAGGWTCTGGHLEPDEDPRDNIKRELQEELGLDLGTTDHSIEPLGAWIEDIGMQSRCVKHYDIWYIVRVAREFTPLQTPDYMREFADSRWATPDEAYSLIMPMYRKQLDVYRTLS